jgi:hypothetical protein
VKVYLSGPITGRPKHVQEFADYADLLILAGHEPLDPHSVSAQPHTGDCPPGVRNGAEDPHTWPCYLRTDLIAMLGCDAVFMLPGHAASVGACFERHVAERCGMPIYFSLVGL